MKKVFLLLALIFLVGCASNKEPVVETAEPADLKTQITLKDSRIADLEYQNLDLTEKVSALQLAYDALQVEEAAAVDQPSPYLCENSLENMKYTSVVGAIAILEGWFAIQPVVQEMQGTYSTQFWNGVESRIHTIRYISAEDNLTTTDSFMIFFEEGGWQEGLLWMTKQCWLDYPY